MEYIKDADLEYLRNKYHLTEEPFNPYKRYQYHGVNYDASTGMDDAQMHGALQTLYSQIRTEPHPIVKAKAFACVLDNMRIDVNAHDYYVGLYNWGRPLSFLQKLWQQEAFAGYEAELQQAEDLRKSGAVTMWPDFDHVIPDWQALLSLGFPGLLHRVEAYHRRRRETGITPEQEALFQGMEIEYKAILRLLERLREYALAHPSEKTPQVAACLETLRLGPPKSTYDALQAIYIFFMLCEHVDNFQTRSLGNGLDRGLYPFYLADLESGAFTKAQIETFVAYFYMQYSAIGNYWGHPMYLGGVDAAGNTRVNEMSYLLLRVYDKMGIYNPKLQIKVSPNTPEPFLNRALDMIRSGHNSIVFCCEPGYIRAVMGYGASAQEAADWEVSGCIESRVRANESSTIVGYVNALEAVMLALENGYSPVLGKTIGPQTGEAEGFSDFDSFYQAFLKQWEHLIVSSMRIGREVYDPALEKVNPSLMYSATLEGALEKAVDGYARGCKFNNSSMLNCGFASAVDALMVVKHLVFTEKTVTLAQLNRALANNWEGWELLRAKALRLQHKYGNNDPQADQLAAHMAKFFTDTVNNRPNGRCGVYKSLLHSARAFIDQGRKLGATPDGRLAGQEESKSASPSVGMDRNGATALIKSALALTPSSFLEGFCVDLMLHPSAVAGDDGLVVMRALLETYRKNGGMAIQFNVMGTEDLKDAQEHPEKYQNLQVRVCGWNVLWNNLTREEQDMYILRSENIR